MKKLLYIFILLPLFTLAQTADDWNYEPIPTDNSMSVVFPSGTLSDFAGYEMKAYSVQYEYAGPADYLLGIPPIDSTLVPVSDTFVINEQGLAAFAIQGTDDVCDCSQALSGDLIRFFISTDVGYVTVNQELEVVYYINQIYYDFPYISFWLNDEPVIHGCTDDVYLEFDSSANLDDASCSVLFAEGCTDGAADNYDAAANTEDGSCLFTGCMDPSADNYDYNANIDGYCQYLGCTDASACNYDTNANEDDATCQGLVGCTNDSYYEFDASATCDNGSCASPIILGCMDACAFNYNSSATEDDGFCMDVAGGCGDETACNYSNSICNYYDDEYWCNYPQYGYNCDGSLIYEIDSSNYMTVQFPDSEEFVQNSNFQVGDKLIAYFAITYLQNEFLNYSERSSIHYLNLSIYLNEEFEWIGYESTGYGWYWQTEEVEFSNNELIVHGRNVDSIPNGFVQGEEITWVVQKTDGVLYNAFLTYNTAGYDGTYEQGEFVVANLITVGAPFYEGCMNPTTPSYNPLAAQDDGSCTTPYSIGCMDENALNYAGVGANPTHDNATNFGDAFVDNSGINLNTGATFSSGIAANIHDQDYCQSQVEGCTDAMAINYDALATQNDKTICDWSLNAMTEYNVDSDGNILETEYSFGAVDPINENDGIVGSDFDNANVLFWEGALNPDAHVIDNLADVMEWIDNNFQQISVDLAMGWNMIGYSCIHPISAEDALNDFVDEVLIMKDNNGSVYLPEWGFNGIGDLTPGHGYQLKVTNYILNFNICE